MTELKNNIYCGERDDNSVINYVIVTVNGKLLPIDPDGISFQHEDRFDYGENGEIYASKQLSLAILAHEYGPKNAIKYCKPFLEMFVSNFPDSWTLTSNELKNYLKEMEKSIEVK